MADDQAPPPPPPQQPQASPVESTLPPDLQTANATPEDRSTAMIAYILGALTGILGPLILYLVKKEGSSRFLRFHILQMIWLQVAVFVVVIVLFGVIGIGSVVTGGIGCICFPLAYVPGLAALAYCIYGAIQINGGKDFECWLVGPRVRQSL
jgi:uncharacterized protein